MCALEQTPAIETIYARTLRLSLKHLAICSPSDGCGNTTLGWLVARRAALAGENVLLIEFNTRTPSLHEFAQCERKQWTPEDWQTSVQTCHDLSRLDVLTCPDRAGHSIEFHNPESIKQLFSECRQHYNMVICDVPPLLQPHEDNIPADTICSACQGTIVNVLSGITTESQIDEVRDTLNQCGATLAAVVMNDKHTPCLRRELIRETYRLERIFPKWMAKLRQHCDKALLLNQEL